MFAFSLIFYEHFAFKQTATSIALCIKQQETSITFPQLFANINFPFYNNRLRNGELKTTALSGRKKSKQEEKLIDDGREKMFQEMPQTS